MTRTGARARLSRPARRAQLLAAAQEVFVERGYHAAAMDDIAATAGVSKPVLYQHFPGKVDLYVALVQRHAEQLVARVRAALDSTTDNRQRVERSVRAYVDFVDPGDDDGGAFRLVFESELLGDARVARPVEAALAHCAEAVAEVVVADTALEPAEARLVADALAGMAQVTARRWLAAGPDREVGRERLVELLVHLAWRGVSGAPRHGDPDTGAAVGRERTDRRAGAARP